MPFTRKEMCRKIKRNSSNLIASPPRGGHNFAKEKVRSQMRIAGTACPASESTLNVKGVCRLHPLQDRQAMTRSEALFQKALNYLPAGVSRDTVLRSPHPFYASRGHGCIVTDIEGPSMSVTMQP